ncbi:PREDICTED: peptidyl-alpha-hydroxyglycine alpha-amidating lyase 1 [Vollenhovia emeryi]|uniref:peptidyl-alpha-hydroxyglycine alpha-amidating lyase 1 n=1 Tax=Vollenhovia emeryi TaxID=411798 RepID=UPI0005F49C62|nr:PREDICTED: peptidyl-alpha-hydroxyglycine alpha-amidating lyase 1 [Vollenhovia emeryi]XP_011879381.1 PREDICTED: peptidyl-alpha-hydroxyglycine alpha-amidating lyase 1 [Vollenhovia emeryi]
MTTLRCDTVCSVLILLHILVHTKAALRDILSAQHLPDTKFSANEYSDDDREYSDVEVDRDRGSLMQPSEQQNTKDRLYLKADSYIGKKEPVTAATLNKDTIWDAQWGAQLKFTQVSAVAVDPHGNIAIFHRGDRVWGPESFDNENRFDRNKGPIAQNTIILLDKSGKVTAEWGRNMFYLPHGLTIDQSGNYWVTDVAMHQVFKFDAQDVERHVEELKRAQAGQPNDRASALPENGTLRPSKTLGEAFVPGNDNRRFCKPTDVAVHSNGDFFVSDGYCNSRIIKYNKDGEIILHWGRHWDASLGSAYSQPSPFTFLIAHALALASELNYIYLADRENGRVLCFFANNGTFHKEYSHPDIGTKIYSVAYAREKLYLINGPDPFISNPAPVRGFVLDIHSGKVLSMFQPNRTMDNPHDLAVTEDGSEIYAVELNNRKIYRFLRGVNNSQSAKRHQPKILVHPDTKDDDIEKTNATKLILSLGSAAISFITLCIAIAAIVARCQKRGCLLTMRKRMRWEAERRENFKLTSLLESRRGRGFRFLEKRPNPRDFSKLSTEPETSEDEHPENSLARVI